MRIWPKEFPSPGLSLIPILLGCGIVVPIVLVVLSAGQTSTGEREADARRFDPNAALSAASQQLAELFRPAILSSFRVRAIPSDVDEATSPATVGAWIAPRALDPRPGVQFRISTGLAANESSAAASARELEFVMDDGEQGNGVDDDGDGLIDEGILVVRQEGEELVLMANVEMFSVALDGRSLRVTLGCALRDDSGNIDRAVTVRDFVIRNS